MPGVVSYLWSLLYELLIYENPMEEHRGGEDKFPFLPSVQHSACRTPELNSSSNTFNQSSEFWKPCEPFKNTKALKIL